jgi:hypothetical protein
VLPESFFVWIDSIQKISKRRHFSANFPDDVLALCIYGAGLNANVENLCAWAMRYQLGAHANTK